VRGVCDRSQPEGWTGCSSGQQAVGQVEADTNGRHSPPRQPGWGAEPLWVMPGYRTPKPDSDPHGPLHETHRTRWPWRLEQGLLDLASWAADSLGLGPVEPRLRKASTPPWLKRACQTWALWRDTPRVWATSA
jgi:hypothetical protein